MSSFHFKFISLTLINTVSQHMLCCIYQICQVNKTKYYKLNNGQCDNEHTVYSVSTQDVMTEINMTAITNI
jgi:hypothetical protein